MNNKSRIKIKRFMGQLGLSVSKAKTQFPLDLTASGMDPVSAVYQAWGKKVLLRVPLARCVHFGWLSFGCGQNSASPFVRTLVEYESGQCVSYKGSALEAFYERFRPRSASDLMGLPVPNNAVLAELPPIAAPILWRPEHPSQKVEDRRKVLRADNGEHGGDMGAEEGDPFYGPVSEKKGEFEFRRLVKVYESIKKNRFIVDPYGYNNIKVVCLVSGDGRGWRCAIASGGQHRIAALAALGRKKITVQLDREGLAGLVHECDVAAWPVVVNGYVSQDEALSIFRRIFNCQQPSTYIG